MPAAPRESLDPTKGKSKQSRETPILRLRVRGPGIRRGRIPVPDLIRICQELQNAVTKQAEALEGRKTIHPGPAVASIQRECTLELLGIREGSTRLEFGLAKPQLPLIPDAGIGIEVVRELTGSIRSLGNGNRKNVDPGVLQGLYALGSVVQSQRVSSIEFSSPKIGRKAAIKGTFNQRVTERVAERLSSPRKAIVHVDGILDMADFKQKDLKCRVDPPIGAPIACTFGPSQADLIYSLMRQPVRISGEATLQPYTDRIESVVIGEIKKLPTLFMGEKNFFADRSIQQLAAEQGIKRFKDISPLSGCFDQDDNVDEFVADIYSARK